MIQRMPFVIILLFSLWGTGRASDPIRTDSEIFKVTVFLQGAQVTREAEVNLSSGTNEIVFEELSTRIDENSIQVRGEGEFTIISVEHTQSAPNKEEKRNEKLQAKLDSLEDIQFKLNLRQSLKRVYSEEKGMILSNKNIKGEQMGVNIEDLMELAVYYRKRLKEIEYKLLEVNKDIQEMNEDRSNLQKRINKIRHEDRQKNGAITIRLRAANSGPKALQLSYMVRQAGWTPGYDIRSKDIEGPVELIYKGNIQQNTGNDWKDVELTLSTGEPVKSGNQPELNPWNLKTYMPSQQSNYLRQSKGKARNVPFQQQQQIPKSKKESLASASEGQSRRDARYQPPSTPSSTAQRNNVNTAFKIDMPYSIPSDNKKYAVEISNNDLPVEYQYFTVPKVDPDAFLLANVTGWEKLELLPGKTGIYYQGTYVGQSYLDPNITADTLGISLGRDQGIVIDRNRTRDKTKTSIIGGNKKVTISVEIKLRNNKQKAADLLVKDQIPLSHKEEVKVELTEKGDATLDAQTGILDWELTLEPGASKTLKFTYVVEHPKELKVSGL